MMKTARKVLTAHKVTKLGHFFSCFFWNLLQQDRFIWTILTFNTCQGSLALPVVSPRISSVFSCLLCVFLFIVWRLFCRTWPAGARGTLFYPSRNKSLHLALIYYDVGGDAWMGNGRMKTLCTFVGLNLRWKCWKMI